jgi:hypothetical protein
VPFGWHVVDVAELESSGAASEFWDSDVVVPEDDATFLRARACHALRDLCSAVAPSAVLATALLPEGADSPGEIAIVGVASVSVLPQTAPSFSEIRRRLGDDHSDRLCELVYENRVILECTDLAPYASQMTLVTGLDDGEGTTVLVELVVDGPGGHDLAELWRGVSEYMRVTPLDALSAYPRSRS